MALKNRLRQIRHSRCIDKQITMANMLNLPQPQYNRYEKNQIQPSFEMGIKIAKKLGLSVEEIFYIEDEETGE